MLLDCFGSLTNFPSQIALGHHSLFDFVAVPQCSRNLVLRQTLAQRCLISTGRPHAKNNVGYSMQRTAHVVHALLRRNFVKPPILN